MTADKSHRHNHRSSLRSRRMFQERGRRLRRQQQGCRRHRRPRNVPSPYAIRSQFRRRSYRDSSRSLRGSYYRIGEGRSGRRRSLHWRLSRHHHHNFHPFPRYHNFHDHNYRSSCRALRNHLHHRIAKDNAGRKQTNSGTPKEQKQPTFQLKPSPQITGEPLF